MQQPDPAKNSQHLEVPEIAAGGSLPQAAWLARPSPGRRARLMVEIGLVFVAGPLAMSYAVHALRLPLLLMLLPVLAALLVFLARDPTFRLKREFQRGIAAREIFVIAALFLFVGGVLSVFMWLDRPSDFLSFPTYNPRLWALVMIFYPLLSALPQELGYRTFFFHRYGPLFGDRRWLAIVVDAVLFGFAHVIFRNETSVLLSGMLGLVLAWRYTRTRSLLTVWLEHSLYGQLVFTVGLGRYFFTGFNYGIR